MQIAMMYGTLERNQLKSVLFYFFLIKQRIYQFCSILRKKEGKNFFQEILISDLDNRMPPWPRFIEKTTRQEVMCLGIHDWHLTGVV